jgi:hypothetical protein
MNGLLETTRNWRQALSLAAHDPRPFATQDERKIGKKNHSNDLLIYVKGESQHGQIRENVVVAHGFYINFRNPTNTFPNDKFSIRPRN